MFKKIVIVSLTAIVIDFFYGDRTTDIISGLIKAVFYARNSPSNNVHISSSSTERLFTKEDLKLFNGIDNRELYLAILGNVFDVSKGAKHYGPNQQYNIFVGRDASRSFVTGKFNKEDLSDDVADLTLEELSSLNDWLNFYKKEYTKVGLLIGRYFNEFGQQTPYGEAVASLIKESEETNEKNNLEKLKFPPCNVEWDPNKGTRIWCSTKSGGIERDWAGVPRQLYEPRSKSYRCACINENNENLGLIKEYEGCDIKSDTCFVK